MINNPVIRWVRRECRHAYHALHPESCRRSSAWLNQSGPEFMRLIGVRPGDTVLDFGCGPGFFCLPAARAVGAGGSVCAVDKDLRVLRKVRRLAAAHGLNNLHTAAGLAEAAARLAGRLCDFILFYDMLHFLDAPERRDLYARTRGMLTDRGRISAHLKHVIGAEPGQFFAGMTAADAAREIETAGFRLDQKIPTRIWHSYDAEESLVWNFIKQD